LIKLMALVYTDFTYGFADVIFDLYLRTDIDTTMSSSSLLVLPRRLLYCRPVFIEYRLLIVLYYY
jgi:hypothetical protein